MAPLAGEVMGRLVANHAVIRLVQGLFLVKTAVRSIGP